MSNKRSLYLVPKTLDAQLRVVGLPIDELVPAVFFAIFFFMMSKVVLSILVPIIAVILIKALKKGQGSSWIVNLAYWYMPKVVMNNILKYTPASENREYIS